MNGAVYKCDEDERERRKGKAREREGGGRFCEAFKREFAVRKLRFFFFLGLCGSLSLREMSFGALM